MKNRNRKYERNYKNQEDTKDICGIEYGLYSRYYPGELEEKMKFPNKQKRVNSFRSQPVNIFNTDNFIGIR